MAAYKLEDNIREKMEARELKPSTNAWEKMEAKLDAAQPKKKLVLWYYAAASLVGLLILSSFFFNRNNSEENNQIVNKTIKTQNSETQVEIIPNFSEANEIVSIEKNSEKDKTSISDEKEKQNLDSKMLKTIPQQKSEVDKKIRKTEMIANVSEEKKKIVEEKSILAEEEKHFNTKVEEVVASVKKLQETNPNVSAKEVEVLLNNARRDIKTQKILNNRKVDATALLQDVEWELEKSFRDKVFDALGESFIKIRTAVIERNE